MIDTKKVERPRGRPRNFDVEGALATAQRLFHERGYDGVSLAQLTEALGINPPSFYAAFGSKAELFERVLGRYAGSALPIDDILRPGRSVPEALTALLVAAASIYVANPKEAGCLVIEATRSSPDADGAQAARQYRVATLERVRDFIAQERPAVADRLADFVDLTMSGLSASARDGWSEARMRDMANMASTAIEAAWRSAE